MVDQLDVFLSVGSTNILFYKFYECRLNWKSVHRRTYQTKTAK